jgi:hypothetical protein
VRGQLLQFAQHPVGRPRPVRSGGAAAAALGAKAEQRCDALLRRRAALHQLIGARRREGASTIVGNAVVSADVELQLAQSRSRAALTIHARVIRRGAAALASARKFRAREHGLNTPGDVWDAVCGKSARSLKERICGTKGDAFFFRPRR